MQKIKITIIIPTLNTCGMLATTVAFYFAKM